MLSKFFRPSGRIVLSVLVTRKTNPTSIGLQFKDYIPPSQYDIPFPNKLRLGYAMRVYWETIPLFITTAIALAILFSAILWACNHKVDVVFTSRSRANISRTMDLRNPTVHKMIIINQRYKPWPEMQEVLDKMMDAEKRALSRAQSCNFP